MTKEECEIETSKAIMEMRNHIEELEEKISILLSCKNCSENKGGLLCQKEYEGKCLAQKIQYIKELQEENAELEKELEQAKKVQVVEHFEAYGQCRDSRRIASLEAQIEKMKRLLEKWYKQHSDKTYTQTFYDELIKATEGFLWSDICVK